MREKFIESYLVKRVKEMGGICFKVQWVNRRGAPDRLVAAPSIRHFWIELKAPGVKPEPHQIREHERMRQYGMRVEVVDSIERVDEVLRCN